MPYKSEKEQNDFLEAIDSEILCDIRYCPFHSGKIPHKADDVCEGEFCDDAWDNFCDTHDKEY